MARLTTTLSTRISSLEKSKKKMTTAKNISEEAVAFSEKKAKYWKEIRRK